MNELKLIGSLLDQKVRHTLDILTALEEKDWQQLSHPRDSILSCRIRNDVTIADIIKHVVIFEHCIIDAIKSKEHGAVLSTEGDDSFCQRIGKNSDIVTCYQNVHEENLDKILGLQQRDLDKRLMFNDQAYTGVGLLWMLIGHHAFHLGQLRSTPFSAGM